jgi:hypothetical protein
MLCQQKYKATPNGVFISLFPRISCYLKCFETVNKTTPKIHNFILEFLDTKFYVVSLVVYG